MDDSPLPTAAQIASLTPRERECLLAGARGEQAKETGQRLDIGHRTVQNHQQNAARKLGLRGTVKAAQALLEAERIACVNLPSVPEPAGNAAEPAAIPVLPEPTPPPQASDGMAAAGRIVQLNPIKVLLLVLASGLVFTVIVALAANAYRVLG